MIRSLLRILLWKVQKFAMLVHDWKIAYLQEVWSVVWTSCDGVADHCCAGRFCTRQCKKEYNLSSGCVEGLVQVPEANVLSSRQASSTYSYLPSKRNWLCWFMHAVCHKNGKPSALSTLHLAALLWDSTLLCLRILHYLARQLHRWVMGPEQQFVYV